MNTHIKFRIEKVEITKRTIGSNELELAPPVFPALAHCFIVVYGGLRITQIFDLNHCCESGMIYSGSVYDRKYFKHVKKRILDPDSQH